MSFSGRRECRPFHSWGNKMEACVVVDIRPESRKKFERLGLAFTVKSLDLRTLTEKQHSEAQHWIVEEGHRIEREERWRYWAMLVLTFIAAVAAIVAAIPVVKDWLR
jgi:hypothetical protein